MSTTMQIRNVPEPVHRTIKARAALSGLTLSDYLLREVTALARRPTFDELLARIAERGATKVSESSADVIRSERRSRR